MKLNPKILIVAGEASGDLHASNMVAGFKKIHPGAEFYGVGGSLMNGVGVRLIRNIDDLSTYGIFEVFAQLPRLIGVFFDILFSIKKEKPDAVVLVDYPDFNIRLARGIRWLHGSKVKILYYIAPQVWIWRKTRAKVLAKLVDRLAVVLPFEKPLFENIGASVHFVGHPLLDVDNESKNKPPTTEPFPESAKKKIALLPGSRRGELKTYMQPMLEASRLLAESGDGWHFSIIKAPTLNRGDFAPYLNGAPNNVTLVEGSTREILKKSDFAIVALGTATLETALAGTPAVFVGKVSSLSSKFGIRFLGMNLAYYSLVNFILGRPAYPELIQILCAGPEIAATAADIMGSSKKLESLRNAGKQVQSNLEVEYEKGAGGGTASERAAYILDEMIGENR